MMTQVFSWLDAHASGIQAFSSVAALAAIAVAIWQVRVANKWNRHNSVLQLAEVEYFNRLECQAIEECRNIGVKYPHPLTVKDAKTICANRDAYMAIKNLAVCLDRLATGYCRNYYDKRLFELTFGPWVEGHCKYLEAYIAERREQEGEGCDIYCELVSAAQAIASKRQSKRGNLAPAGASGALRTHPKMHKEEDTEAGHLLSR